MTGNLHTKNQDVFQNSVLVHEFWFVRQKIDFWSFVRPQQSSILHPLIGKAPSWKEDRLEDRKRLRGETPYEIAATSGKGPEGNQIRWYYTLKFNSNSSDRFQVGEIGREHKDILSVDHQAKVCCFLIGRSWVSGIPKPVCFCRQRVFMCFHRGFSELNYGCAPMLVAHVWI